MNAFKNLHAFDLNLLLTFWALHEEGSVTKAALRMGLSQPAMSHTLARLREMLGDPLFVRRGRALVATPRAQALAPVVKRVLDELDRNLSGPSPFEPKNVEVHYRLGLSDYWQFALLPRLLARLEQDAPGVSLETHEASEGGLRESLPSGALDAAIFLSPTRISGLYSDVLLADRYACIVRRDHPQVRRTLSLADYAGLRHVVVTPRGPWHARAERALREASLVARPALENAHVQVALDIVSTTDFLAMLPLRIARQAQRSWPIRVLKPPFDAGQFELALYWHERTNEDPAQRWLRRQVVELAKETYLDPTRVLRSEETHGARRREM